MALFWFFYLRATCLFFVLTLSHFVFSLWESRVCSLLCHCAILVFSLRNTYLVLALSVSHLVFSLWEPCVCSLFCYCAISFFLCGRPDAEASYIIVYSCLRLLIILFIYLLLSCIVFRFFCYQDNCRCWVTSRSEKLFH